jgi:uncharacterized membrane protein
MNSPPDIVLFLGRFHPVLVHLPIGFVILLVALELLARLPRFKGANASVGYVLALTLPAVAASATCGWLVSLGGGYDPGLVAIHRWGGMTTTILCALTALLYWLDLRRTYYFCLFITAIALTVAAHFGASLTHGRGYLLRYAPQPVRSWSATGTPPARAGANPAMSWRRQAAGEVIQQLFERRCTSCHNLDKKKGGLQLDNLEGLLKGGDGGPVMVAHRAGDSPIIARMLLPITHEDHMPPEGKPQPAPEEIALLRWWIDAGAPTNQPINDLDPPPHVVQALDTFSRKLN